MMMMMMTVQMMMMSDCCPGDADTKAVKTGTIQTQVIDGFQILRSEHSNQTMLHLVEWTKALKRKYDHLTVSATKQPRHCTSTSVFLLAACCVQSIYSSADECQSRQYIGSLSRASALVIRLQKAHVKSTVSLLHIRHDIDDSSQSAFGHGDCTSTCLISWT